MQSWKTTIDINGLTIVFGLTIVQTIGTNSFAMVFGPATSDADDFDVQQPLYTKVFHWFPIVASHFIPTMEW